VLDYSLRRGLPAARTGDFEEARKALSGYLEVRAMDRTAPRILNWFLAQERLLKAVLSPLPITLRWQFSQPDLQEEWGGGILRPFNVKGLGQGDALGAALCLCDTLGGNVYRSEGGNGFRAVSVPSPAAALPVGDGTFFVFGVDGNVHSFFDISGENISLDLRGHVNSHIVDACWISEAEFAVADPIARSIDFYDRESLRHLASWSPPEGDMLFVEGAEGAVLQAGHKDHECPRHQEQ